MIDVNVAFADTSRISFKDIVTVIQTVVTTIAIFVAGFWTYFVFVKKRQRFPRASISHNIFYKDISGGKLFLNVKTAISNTGDVLLCLESGVVRVQQILPVPKNIDNLIRQGYDPVPEDRTEVDWPLIGTRSFTWEKGTCEIEPGEHDNFVADYVIDANVQLIAVYSYFKNAKKRNRDIGWGTTTIYEIECHLDQTSKEEGGKING